MVSMVKIFSLVRIKKNEDNLDNNAIELATKDNLYGEGSKDTD